MFIGVYLGFLKAVFISLGFKQLGARVSIFRMFFTFAELM